MIMNNIIWIGARESDIEKEKMFFGSITRYGTNSKSNVAFINNDFTDDYNVFLKKTIENAMEMTKNCKFIFANPENAYKFGRKVYEYSLCLNKQVLFESLNNKIFFRQLISDVVKVPPSIIIETSSNLDYEFIKSIFNNKFDYFVIQSANSAGGENTFLLSKNTQQDIYNYFCGQTLVTPYFQGAVAVNVHIVLSANDFRIFPPSIQLISNLFHYTGCDFIYFRSLDKTIRDKIISQCSLIAKKLLTLGALGLFGVDILIADKSIYFIECNFRYQGSTFLLNEALCENGLNSVFSIHYDSFYNHNIQLPLDIYDLKINYSSFRRTLDNLTINLPNPLEVRCDGDINKEKRNGYIQYEIYNKSIYDFLI